MITSGIILDHMHHIFSVINSTFLKCIILIVYTNCRSNLTVGKHRIYQKMKYQEICFVNKHLFCNYRREKKLCFYTKVDLFIYFNTVKNIKDFIVIKSQRMESLLSTL
jgi:sporulation protein YlmC with PRC-barrel domain